MKCLQEVQAEFEYQRDNLYINIHYITLRLGTEAERAFLRASLGERGWNSRAVLDVQGVLALSHLQEETMLPGPLALAGAADHYHHNTSVRKKSTDRLWLCQPVPTGGC